jgi:hypothetical protein
VARLLLGTDQTGTFRFCVRHLGKTGYSYQPGADETPACKTIVVGP